MKTIQEPGLVTWVPIPRHLTSYWSFKEALLPSKGSSREGFSLEGSGGGTLGHMSGTLGVKTSH